MISSRQCHHNIQGMIPKWNWQIPFYVCPDSMNLCSLGSLRQIHQSIDIASRVVAFLFKFGLRENIIEGVRAVHKTFRYNNITPRLASIIGCEIRGEGAKFLGSICFCENFVCFQILISLCLTHINGVVCLNNKVRLISFCSIPVNIELIRNGT